MTIIQQASYVNVTLLTFVAAVLLLLSAGRAAIDRYLVDMGPQQ